LFGGSHAFNYQAARAHGFELAGFGMVLGRCELIEPLLLSLDIFFGGVPWWQQEMLTAAGLPLWSSGCQITIVTSENRE
jgi:hypothetical protein